MTKIMTVVIIIIIIRRRRVRIWIIIIITTIKIMIIGINIVCFMCRKNVKDRPSTEDSTYYYVTCQRIRLKRKRLNLGIIAALNSKKLVSISSRLGFVSTLYI